ncbi:pyocin knob domain-containing protein [Paenibacillus sp. FSL K6-4396]|uniref:pyocin knob domain-containing protein n=1 Tax=unclassified Paenibacillus TaxID=185978 RepID=UPI00177F8CA0|nr:pyocin knob domain-containing protein [Paenibacillus sp. CFBP 13594]MBD8838720.1 hypothetical protein [Paenibacillus sp. CFBP 13594]
MNEPKTPNLGLNKIDRSSPSTTYFDLDKYLDQNWEKVDEGVGQVEEKAEETAAQVSSIQERLDTEKRRSVTLEPGLQIINAERASAFKLEGLKGRTLVNLLGRDGGCESTVRWLLFQGAASIDQANKTEGSNGIKLTVTSGAFATATAVSKINAKANKFYIAVVYTKNGNATNASFYASGLTATKGVNSTANATKFVPLWRAYAPTSDVVASVIVQTNGSATGQYAYFDGVRFYEITATEYAALDSMTPEQVGAKYPYVDSVQPVRNPYAIRYGENLLPPFYEATYRTKESNIIGPYTYEQTAESTDGWTRLSVTVLPQTDYCLSFSGLNGKGKLAVFSADEQTLLLSYGQGERTFNSGKLTQIVVYINGTIDGADTILNPMLNIGKTAKPFKPREDVMFALQTDLFADPVTGANADEVFEKDGQYFKLAKWRRVVLDSTLSWKPGQLMTGYKKVYITPYDVTNTLLVSKFDGSLLGNAAGSEIDYGGDRFFVNLATKVFEVSILNADSGWGNDYLPTADEVKAYFMGWRMFPYEQGGSVPIPPYNGTGTKAWVQLDPTSSTGVQSGAWTMTLPQSLTTNVAWSPYQLVYQLATPIVEPIMSEGQLTFIEGNNQIEVGTGNVLREATKPALSTQWSTYEINSLNAGGGVASNPLKYKAKKVMTIYKNGLSDKWERSKDANSYGLERAYQSVPLFDSLAAYRVTYLMMDTSPVASFVGSVADNEKALLMNLTDTVQQNVAALSMLKIAIPNGDTLKNYVDNKPWQKYKITQDNGSVIQLAHSSDLNNIKTGGQYDCFNAINGPGGVANAWFYVEVLVHSNAPTHVIQRASRLDTHNTPTLYMRTCMDNIWSAWSPDVFQSGVNAKNGIVDAVNAMGGSASINDTWSTLANKIKQIKTGKQFATGQFVIGSNGTGSVNGLAFKPRHITFANATNTPNYIYYGIYSEESPRNNYSTGDTRVLNRVVGLDNGLSVDDKIIPTVNGFNVSGTGITDQRTYNYFATE